MHLVKNAILASQLPYSPPANFAELTQSGELSAVMVAQQTINPTTKFAAHAGLNNYFTIGNDPANENGSIVVHVAENGTITFEHALDEQGASTNLATDGTNIFVPGVDPTESWDFGNLYVRDNLGAWSKKRNLTNVIHSFGSTYNAGTLYIATGGHTGDESTFRAYLFQSDDAGDTWSSDIVTFFRAYDVKVFNSKIYVTIDSNGQYLVLYSENNGDTWNLLANAIPKRQPRMILWNNLLIFLGNNDDLYAINTNNEFTAYTLPYSVSPDWNIFGTDGNHLYTLLTDRIYRTQNLINWQHYCNLPGRCVGLTMWANSLIVSELGSNARLLEVPIT